MPIVAADRNFWRNSYGLTADESGTVFNTNKLACSHLCSVPIACLIASQSTRSRPEPLSLKFGRNLEDDVLFRLL